MKKYLVLAVALVILLTGTIHTQFTNANEDAKVDVGFIDERLPENDKVKLKEVMKHLDPEDRKNVYYFQLDGSFTANRIELIDEFKKQNKDIIDKNGRIMKEDLQKISSTSKDKGAVKALAYVNPSSPCDNANSGPYRKVTSSNGLTRLTTNVYLPIKNTEVVTNNVSNESAWIYTGAINNDNSSIQVDAGLKLNWGDGIAPVTSTEETWAMGYLGMTIKSGTAGNFKMGQTVFMKFYVSATDEVVLNVEGYNKSNVYQSITMTFAVPSTKGFTIGGSAMKVKRITSIGQTTQDLNSGSYLNNVAWSNVKVGTTSGTEQLENAATTSISCGYQTTNVLVDFTSYSQETVKVKAGTLP